MPIRYLLAPLAALALLVPTAEPAHAAGLQAPRASVLETTSWIGTFPGDPPQAYVVTATFGSTHVRGATSYRLYSSFDGGAVSREPGAAAVPGRIRIPFYVEGLPVQEHALRFWVVACESSGVTRCSRWSNPVTIHLPA
jgi:hypothetical protein